MKRRQAEAAQKKQRAQTSRYGRTTADDADDNGVGCGHGNIKGGVGLGKDTGRGKHKEISKGDDDSSDDEYIKRQIARKRKKPTFM